MAVAKDAIIAIAIALMLVAAWDLIAWAIVMASTVQFPVE
jgi:hypothetical protein